MKLRITLENGTIMSFEVDKVEIEDYIAIFRDWDEEGMLKTEMQLKNWKSIENLGWVEE